MTTKKLTAITTPQENIASQITPMGMLAAAVEGGASMEVLEKLMGLQERWQRNLARQDFEAAIADAKAEIKPIPKNRKVGFDAKAGGRSTNYDYEDLGGIALAVDPILAKHGLSYRYRSSQEGPKLTVTCVVSHREGYSEETTLSVGNDTTGNKNSIQAVGSAATYLQRYTLKLALGLAASKDDDGNTSDTTDSGTISCEQGLNIEELIKEYDADRDRFLEWAKIDEIPHLPAKKYNTAVNLIKQKKKVVK